MCDPDSLVDEILSLCNCTAVLDSRQLLRCHKIGQALSELCQRQAEALLRSHSGRPVVFVYVNDGWSAKVRSDHRLTQVGKSVCRQGHFRTEFLLERGLMKAKTLHGEDQMVMTFGVPRGLHLGKSSWNILQAASDFAPLLRASGHSGLCLTLYLQDGALFASSFKLFKARHALFYESPAFLDNEGHDAMDSLRDIVVGMRCKMHACHNSVAWGLGQWQSQTIVDECFIVVESLLNCSSEIYAKMDTMLSRKVVFVRRDDAVEDVEAFWKALEVNASMMPLFLELNPWWTGSHLEVSSECEHDVEVLQKLSSLLLYGYRWMKFATSRWCRAGRSGRVLFVGWLWASMQQLPKCSPTLMCRTIF
jgi:hypothetical protein